MARRQRGQAFAEYAVGLAMAAVLVPAVALAGAPIVGLFVTTTSAIANVADIAGTTATSPAPTDHAVDLIGDHWLGVLPIGAVGP